MRSHHYRQLLYHLSGSLGGPQTLSVWLGEGKTVLCQLSIIRRLLRCPICCLVVLPTELFWLLFQSFNVQFSTYNISIHCVKFPPLQFFTVPRSSLLLSIFTVYSSCIVTAVVTHNRTFSFASVSGDHKAGVESAGHTGCCDGVQDIAVLFRYSSACPESIHAICNGGAVPPSAALKGSLLQWKYHGGTISNRSAGVALWTLILLLVWLREWCTPCCQACRVPMKY